jgi:hypothetical protein
MEINEQKKAYKEVTGKNADSFTSPQEIGDQLNDYLLDHNDVPATQVAKLSENAITYLKFQEYAVDKEKGILVFEGTENEIPVAPAPQKGVKAKKGKVTTLKGTGAESGKVEKPRRLTEKKDWTKEDLSPIVDKTYVEDVRFKQSRVSLWSGGRVHFKIVGNSLFNKMSGNIHQNISTVAEIVKIISDFEGDHTKYDKPKKVSKAKKSTKEKTAEVGSGETKKPGVVQEVKVEAEAKKTPTPGKKVAKKIIKKIIKKAVKGSKTEPKRA